MDITLITPGVIRQLAADMELTLRQLNAHAMQLLFAPAPTQQDFQRTYRIWTLSSEMLAAERRAELQQHYTTETACPHCGAEPLLTGGKRPVTYCPSCDARVLDGQWLGSDWYRRWSEPRCIPV